MVFEIDSAVMSDSDQQQLYVPYREYQSQNNIIPTGNLVETDALVDLSLTPTSTLPQDEEFPELLPDVAFIPNLNCDQTIAIDSPGIDRESQPLLGRLDVDVSYNRFPGIFINYYIILFTLIPLLPLNEQATNFNNQKINQSLISFK